MLTCVLHNLKSRIVKKCVMEIVKNTQIPQNVFDAGLRWILWRVDDVWCFISGLGVTDVCRSVCVERRGDLP